MASSRHDNIHTPGRLLPRILLFVLVVLFMGNLGAIVDSVLHPEIEYFDEEHLIVGSITALVTIVLFGGLALYARNREKALAKLVAADRARRASDTKYREIFEESRDVVFVASLEGRFLEMNQAGVELFGYGSLDEIRGVDLANELYVDPAEYELMKLRLEQDGYVKDYEVAMRRKDGDPMTISQSLNLVPGSDGEGGICRGIMHDVTEERELHRQLVQSHKMESVGRLAGGIAHDFNNLLTTISGYTDMALDDEPANTPTGEYLREIHRAADQASALTAQLILFSQSQPADARPFDLNRLVTDSLGKIDQAAGEGVSVATDLLEGAAVINASYDNIEHVLLNLIKNAKAAMPDGGHLLIRTDHEKIDQEYTKRHSGAYPGDFYSLTVVDTGSGMDAETRAHIFEPFFTTAQDRHGARSGLGLSVVYGVITQHDGWVEVESEPGEGTSFSLYLPLSHEPVLPEDGNGSLEELKGHGERILLVEDDESVRRLTEKMLVQNGYSVFSVADAGEAFDMFARQKGEFQLIFSDVALPGENGVKLVEHLHSYKPDLPVLLVSGYSDIFADWRFVQEKGYRFMQKPYVLPNLLHTIRDLLEARN